MEAFREFWIVVLDKDDSPSYPSHLQLPSNGLYQRHFTEKEARETAKSLAIQHTGKVYVVLHSVAACVKGDVEWLNPAPF